MKEQQIENIPSRDFHATVRKHINDYLIEHHYPILCDWRDGYELKSVEMEVVADTMMDIDRKAAYDARKCSLMVELCVRASRDNKNRAKSFKSIVKSGPSYEMKISELIDRRKNGFSYDGDNVMQEITQVGYNSPQQMLDAYSSAENIVEKLRWIKYRYENLSVEEQNLLLGSQTD